MKLTGQWSGLVKSRLGKAKLWLSVVFLVNGFRVQIECFFVFHARGAYMGNAFFAFFYLRALKCFTVM